LIRNYIEIDLTPWLPAGRHPSPFAPHPGGGVEKDHFNRRERKVDAKNAELKHCVYVLCDLSEKPLRPLRLMDFDFFNTPSYIINIQAITLQEKETVDKERSYQ
jgi:hypothetical protein